MTAGDVDTIGINNAACTSGQTTGGCYSYTVLSTDTLASVAQAFVNLINTTPDPYVTASLTNEFTTILLTAIVPGPDGEGITCDSTGERECHRNPDGLQRGSLLLEYPGRHGDQR